jgi:cobalt/nickel transport system permease protein
MTLAASLRDFHRLDLLAGGDSALHRLDPRAKLLATLAFIVCVMSYERHAVAALVPYFAVAIVAAAAAGLPGGFIARRALVVLPFAVLVGLANPWLDRAPVAVIGAHALAGGWLSLASIILRSLLAATAALVLVATTGFPAICAALTRMAVPRALVVQLLLLYRYLTVLGDEWLRMAAACELRACGAPLSLRLFGTLAGSLLLRTSERAERIYAAMRARGFDGSFPAGGALRFRLADAGFGALALLVLGALRFGELPRHIGIALLGLVR